ncbi:MAG: glycosyltransferase family 39 protein [Bacteroidales bacterium]|nr:glycosyltransferase family 39 protein [Bacteroidales bacterium]
MKKTISSFLIKYWILLLIISVKLILQFSLVNPVYELHRDEFLHLDQAYHLAFGYISVPPLTSIFSLLIHFFGGGIFWVRFFPALFGAATIAFTWLIVESLGGSLLSKILASTALLFSVLMRLNILFQPNSFDILAWTIAFYLVIRLIQSGKLKFAFYLAIFMAIGIYNKYNIIFLLTGLGGGLLISYYRNIIKNPIFWKSILLFVILISPNFFWQMVNHWPVVHHMKALKEFQLDNNSALGFLKSQFLFIAGSILIFIAAIAGFITSKDFRNFRIIGFSVLLVFILFTVLKAKDYYAMGLYPVIFAFGSIYIEKLFSSKWRKIVIPLLIINNLVVFTITARLIYPVYSPEKIREKASAFEKLGLLRWEDGENHDLPQDFADMLGWKEMADKALDAFNLIPMEERNKTLVFTDNYGECGAINYYNRGKMPEAYSFNTDYIFWIPQMDTIKNLILVGSKPSLPVIKMFDTYSLIGKVENQYAREKNTEIYLFSGASRKFKGIFYFQAEKNIKNFDIF